jgi:hypothetical protein
MAKTGSKEKGKKKVEILTHKKASRLNIPTAEYQSVMRTEELSPIRVAYERRNRDLDPQLVWRASVGWASRKLERRFPICGYLASNLSRLRRARTAEQFGKVVGYCALRDQYFILWAIRTSRTSGRACTCRFSSAEPPVPHFSPQDTGAVFAAMMVISCVRSKPSTLPELPQRCFMKRV